MDGMINDQEWSWSDERAELFAALAKAQGDITMADKDARNPHLGSKYADLASVWRACRKPLSTNGLLVTQLPVNTAPEDITMHTIIGHSSGQWIRATMHMRPLKSDPQSIGSVITYAKRYMLASMVGVAADDDDDGAQASQPQQGQQRQQKPPQQQQPPAQSRPPAQQQRSQGQPQQAAAQQPAAAARQQPPAGANAPAQQPAAESPQGYVAPPPPPQAEAQQPAAQDPSQQAPPAQPQLPGQRVHALRQASLDEHLMTKDELREWMASKGASSLGQVTPAIADLWEAELNTRRAARQQPQQQAEQDLDLAF